MFNSCRYLVVILLIQIVKEGTPYLKDAAEENTSVNTNVGLIRGLRATDGNYTMFLGIPFAKVDKSNPFGVSERYPNFEEPFQAYQQTAICPQTRDGAAIGTIDCLQLNIFVPDTASSTHRVPVMVFFYGGAFSTGSSERYGPTHIVRHDVILVIFNYRVGPYGFMCLDTPQIPGNQGLKDQLLALRWVKENIEFFGGDANKVTLFGMSAGSMSIHLQLLSPHEELFQRVIMQSGSMYLPEVSFDVDREAPIKLAEALGYNTDDFESALTFLTEQNTDSVILAAAQTGTTFWPCIESDRDGIEPLLTDFPMNLNIPKLQGKSVLLGYTDNEWLSRYANLPEETFETITIFEDFFTNYFNLDEDQSSRIERQFKNFYLGGQDLSREVLHQIANFDSDAIFTYPLQRCIPIFLENGAESIFYYKFSYVGGRNVIRMRANINSGGAVHGDDLGYLFDLIDMELLSEEPTSEDQIMIDRMTLMWTNFAKYGDPTPVNTTLLPVKWEPIKAGDKFDNYLNIDLELTLGRNPLHERIAFWNLFFEAFREYEIGYRRNNAGCLSAVYSVYYLLYVIIMISSHLSH